MKILIAMRLLSLREGGMLFSRELADELQRQGHTVMLYSSDVSAQGPLEENREVSVVTDIGELPFQPDIIHGQTMTDSMAVLMALPGVPAIFHCHGAIWGTCPPRHPRICRYLAMSRTLAERIMAESNIGPERISVFLTPVNLTRFQDVRELPERPKRALFYNGHHGEESATFRAVRQATEQCGLELDCIGRLFDRTIDNPHEVLPQYDIVFASGMAAMEAAACGCAVVVLGRNSCGELLSPENYECVRGVNFSIAGNLPPPLPEAVEAEVRRYSAEACAQVTQQVRRDVDFAKATEELVGIYQDVVERHEATPSDLEAESLANSRYLRKIAPLVRISDGVLDGAWSSVAALESAVSLRARLERVARAIENPRVTESRGG
ncbi:MAG: glycosyltransferase [Verrucomicrobiota bacterium]